MPGSSSKISSCCASIKKRLRERARRTRWSTKLHAKFEAKWLGEVFALQDAGTISSTASRDVLAESLRTGEPPKAIVEAKGLAQVSDNGALETIVDAILARSAAEVARYKAGKTNLMGFFVGAAMKELKGKGNPALLNSLFKAKLGG
jgi:aspartyl-tRNA(Asn)/glutamyl-tRNA(Gln) amidotransferase subunit B